MGLEIRNYFSKRNFVQHLHQIERYLSIIYHSFMILFNTLLFVWSAKQIDARYKLVSRDFLFDPLGTWDSNECK